MCNLNTTKNASLQTAEIKFLRGIAGHTRTNLQRNTEIGKN
jgi:hypothetical protein